MVGAGSPGDSGVFERRTGIGAADFDLLYRMPLFAGIDPEEVRTALASSTMRRFPRNTLLFSQGDEATRFYAVVEGWVKLFRETRDGNESVIGLFTVGDTFAEAAAIKMGQYPVNGAVVADARLLVIPSESFLRVFRRNQQLMDNVMICMTGHLSSFADQIERLTARSSTERLAEFLVRLTPPTSESAVVTLPFDKALIAAKLGMQPETFSRSLAKLRHCGVRADGTNVVIDDVSALQRLCEGGSPL